MRGVTNLTERLSHGPETGFLAEEAARRGPFRRREELRLKEHYNLTRKVAVFIALAFTVGLLMTYRPYFLSLSLKRREPS